LVCDINLNGTNLGVLLYYINLGFRMRYKSKWYKSRYWYAI
jgi:hypothetical protein